MTEDPVERYLSLSPEDQLKENTYYKGQYEAAFEYFDRPIPKPWEELTHEERVRVQQTCIRSSREMNAKIDSLLGKTR